MECSNRHRVGNHSDECDRWLRMLSLRKLKAVLLLLGSALFMASSPGGCETVSDPRHVVVDGRTPGRSTSPFTSGPGYSAARLAEGATSLAWAPDGEHILFSSGGLLGVYVVDSAGLELRSFPETSPQYGDWERPGAFAPSLSPDGARVAYSVFVPWDSSVIETAALDGTDVRRLTPLEPYREENGRTRYPDYQHSIFPVWSPDGMQIAFISNYMSDEWGDRLYVINADGLNVRALAPSVRLECQETWQGPRWSPDGSRLAFAGSEPSVDGRERIGLYTVSFDGSGLTRISDLYSHYCGPAVWSPNGSQLTFLGQIENANGSTSPFFYAAKADGASLIQLADAYWPGSMTPPLPSWSHDGTRVAYQGMQMVGPDTRGPAIYVARLDGSDPSEPYDWSARPMVRPSGVDARWGRDLVRLRERWPQLRSAPRWQRFARSDSRRDSRCR